MASWREEYIKSLKARDEQAKASYPALDDEFMQACKSL